MKLYLCCVENTNGPSKNFNGNSLKVTLDKELALEWKKNTQNFENAAARDGFRGARKMIIRDGGTLPDDGPTKTFIAEGSGAGLARVFELEATEI